LGREEKSAMRTLVSGIVAAIVIAIAAGFILRSIEEPVHDVYASPSTRVGDPGTNLVGRAWTGDPTVTIADRQAKTGTPAKSAD
jgi:hypothetical protein